MLCETRRDMPRLTLLPAALAGQQFGFADSVVIGRGTYCDIRIDDSTVSRKHAEIRRDAQGRWCLLDLGSANGTTCNGKAVAGPVVLDDGSEIVFGEVGARYASIDPSARISEHASTLPGPIGPLDALARVAALLARRGPPARLIEEALDATHDAFTEAQGLVAVFSARAGTSQVSLLGTRGGLSACADGGRALAGIALRHADGMRGDADALSAAGVPTPPACALAIPLRLDGESLGALVVESTRADALGANEHALAQVLAASLASLLDAQRGAHPERRVAERDLLLARRVQQHFLPQSGLRIAGYRVAEAYVPARVVGGDLYDFFHYADGRTGVVIADVSGKAVSAALVMARFGMGVRLLASHAQHPVELLVTLNTLLLGELEPGMFVTAQALALDADTGQVELANAGHPAPLLRDASGRVESLALDAGAPLGADARTAFAAHRFALDPGSALLLYTDGLTDAEDAAGTAFGIEPVFATVAAAIDAQAMLDEIERTLAAFVDSTAASDDLTLVAISRDTL